MYASVRLVGQEMVGVPILHGNIGEDPGNQTNQDMTAREESSVSPQGRHEGAPIEERDC